MPFCFPVPSVHFSFYELQGRANAWSHSDKFIIHIEAPGFTKEDFTINADHHTIDILGKRQEEKREDHTLRYQELSRNNTIQRSFRFGESIDPDLIGATVQNGILTVELPKKSARTIPVNAG